MTEVVGRHEIEDALRQISAMLATAALYAPEHPQVLLLVPRVLETLERLLAKRSELTFIIIKNDLLFEGKPLERTPHAERIARQLQARNIGFIKFSRGLGRNEVEIFLRVAAGLEALETLDTQAPHIDYGKVETQEEDGEVRPIMRFEDLTPEELQSLEDFYSAISNKENLDLREISAIITGFVTAFEQQASPLLALVPLRMEDEYTFTHSINVAILNIAQGMSLGLDKILLRDVGLAGMLHDAGKIFVDQEIIRKPGKLDDEEWRQMQEHPSRGAQYLMCQDGVPQLAIITAFEHHMRYDRAGYPQADTDWQLNICSQMTMISDTFDALRTRRSYKEPWDLPRISGLFLELAGEQLNPDLVMNFLKLLARLGEEVMAEGISLSADAPDLPEAELAARHVCE